jgi:hypothetical protein
MPRLACVVLAQNIRATNRVSVCSETTSRTGKRAPPGFVTLQTGRAIRQRTRGR